MTNPNTAPSAAPERYFPDRHLSCTAEEYEVLRQIQFYARRSNPGNHAYDTLMAFLGELDRIDKEKLSTPPAPPAPLPGKPLTKDQIAALLPLIKAEVDTLSDEGRYTFAGWLPIAVRLIVDRHVPGWCINRAPGVTIAQALVLAVEKLASPQHQVKKGEPS